MNTSERMRRSSRHTALSRRKRSVGIVGQSWPRWRAGAVVVTRGVPLVVVVVLNFVSSCIKYLVFVYLIK